jgi:EAL domain-containing protein (putative c-di-GMP-specific phosphodiesterase class I)
MPFKTLKIDSSFVTGLEPGDPNRELINAICVLGHSLGQQVVAEGVETGEQAKALRDLGCDMMQGYHFDRPLPLKVLQDRWIGDAAHSGRHGAKTAGV